MSARGLVVHVGSLEAMEAALTATHDEILALVDDAFERADAELTEWAIHTASRAAQLERAYWLRQGVERLCRALDDVRTALEQVRSDAHDTEVRNVAVIG